MKIVSISVSEWMQMHTADAVSRGLIISKFKLDTCPAVLCKQLHLVFGSIWVNN